MVELGERLDRLQEALYAEAAGGGHRAVLLVLQGMDTSGKGGVIQHVAGLVNPAGPADRVVQEADRRGAGPRLPVAHPQAGARAGPDRGLRPLALRGRAGRAGRRAGARGRLAGPLRARSTRFEAELGGQGVTVRQVHAAHLARGAGASGCWPASTTRPSAGSTTPATSTRARSGPPTSSAYADALRETRHRRRALVRHPGGPQVVPQLGDRARCSPRRSPSWTRQFPPADVDVAAERARHAASVVA